MSCKEPNIQGIPREKAFRACFRASEGLCIIKADYAQIELRIGAVKAKELRMLDAFRRGDDLHRITAAQVLGKTPAEVSSDERQIAKAVNFGLIYGLGAESLRTKVYDEAEIDITLRQAQAFRLAFFGLYPRFSAWHDELKQAIEKDGSMETRTLMNRRRLGIQSYTEGANSPIQGSAADGFKLALTELYQDRHAHPEARVIAVVHDEILVECPTQDAPAVGEWVKRHMERAMSQAVRGEVPIVADVTIGRDWAGTPL
jgi:DNA polymerase-1